ncbi:MAG: CBS domain-containing protein [Alphaproteobacteria bacterium]|nr:CBS domain-containing protein [Alphaproteobacteria bacterium]
MPCHVAIDENSAVASPQTTIEEALTLIRKKNLAALVVMDETEQVIGIFSSKSLLSNIIPVSFAMSDGVQLDVKIEAAPGVSKRMIKLLPLSITEGMERKYNYVESDAPIWEGVTKITKYGGPLVVLDKKKKFKGLVTYESLIKALENTKQADA